MPLTNLTTAINPSQLLKNYVPNGQLENNSTSGWSLFNTTLTSGLPTGSLVAGANTLSLSAVSLNPLFQTYSLQVSSSGAVTAGQGVITDAFTIDRIDQAKPLTIKIYYEAVSGGTNANWSGIVGSQSFVVYLYDVTASAWVQPAGAFGMNQNSGAGYVTATFQTSSVIGQQYRLAIICLQATSGAISLNLDEVFVGPQTAPIGAPSTDWVSYTPTITGFGTVSTQNFAWRRVGKNVEIIGRFTSGTSTATEARITLPSVTSEAAPLITTLQLCGKVNTNVSSATYFSGNTVLIEPSQTYFVFGRESSTANGMTKQNGNTIATSGDVVSLFCSIPITGWSSNVQMSNDTDTRVVVAARNTLSSTSITGGTALAFTTSSFDTHASFISNSTYSVPVSGFYRATVSGIISSTTASNLEIFVNGSSQGIVTTVITQGRTSGSGVVSVKAGDTITIVPSSSVTASTTDGQVYIERLSGPSVIAANETVACRYTNTAGSSYGTADTLMPFATKDYDTHNAWVTNTFTAPISGKYLANIILTSGSTGIVLNAMLYKNGASFCQVAAGYSTGSTRSVGAATVSLNAGDTLSFYASSNVAGSLSTAAGLNHFSITRVGN